MSERSDRVTIVEAVAEAQEALAENVDPKGGVTDRETVDALLGVLDDRNVVQAVRDEQSRLGAASPSENAERMTISDALEKRLGATAPSADEPAPSSSAETGRRP